MKILITESDIISLYKNGITVIPVGKDDILTPLASDKIHETGISIVKKEEVSFRFYNFR
jgi:hypothetical protein